MPQKYRYQDEDVPHDHSLPRLTHEVRGPELVHVSEKNLSQIENVHGYVLQSHISPLKVSKVSLLYCPASENIEWKIVKCSSDIP